MQLSRSIMTETDQNYNSFTTNSKQQCSAQRVSRVKTSWVFFLKPLPELAFVVSRYACPTSGFSRGGPRNLYTSFEDIIYGSLERDAAFPSGSCISNFPYRFLVESSLRLIPRKGSCLSYIGKGNLCKERLLYSFL